MLNADLRRSLAAAALLVGACGGAPSLSIVPVGTPRPTSIEVRGLPSSDLRALSRANLSEREWQDILTVTVGFGPGQPPPDPANRLPMAGDYRVDGPVVRFTPMFGFDSGRGFGVSFDPAKIPGADSADAWRRTRLSQIIGISPEAKTATTTVKQVYPSGAELPANMLRFYIEFSAPMGRGEALPHIRLVDDAGKDVVDPFLPVEAEFWSSDRTRFTLFFDPGRVKRGIKPNRDMGRALVPGRKYALVIDENWRDGREQPLASGHRHEFTVSPAIEKALNQKDWTITTPRIGSRDPVTVTFPWALDHGLLQRSLGVMRGPADLPGEIAVSDAETRWTFTPRDPWTSGDYSVIALTLLEDPAGNRLGRAFEVTVPTTDAHPSVRVPFTVK